MRRFGLLAGVCLLAWSVTGLGPVGAAEPLDDLAGPAKLEALIDRVVERQRELRSLQAEFVQLKSSELLLEPVESHGEFAFLAPDRVRWDYEAPDEMVVVFADDTLTTYHPQQQRAERVTVASKHRRFVRALAGTQPLDDLASQFAIALTDPGDPEPYRLTLTPTHRTLARRIDRIVLEIDRQLMLPVVVEYRGSDGDLTRYEFRDMKLDPGLEVSRFELELGAEVEVQTLDASG